MAIKHLSPRLIRCEGCKKKTDVGKVIFWTSKKIKTEYLCKTCREEKSIIAYFKRENVYFKSENTDIK